MNLKIKNESFLQSIVALCIILDCECIWKWMHHSGYFKLGLNLCIVFCLLLLILRNGTTIKIIYGKSVATLIGFLIIFFLYNFATNSDHFSDTLLMVFVVLLMAIYLSDKDTLFVIFEKGSKILCFLAIMSLFFWLFGSVLHIFSPNQSLIVYNSDVANVRQSYFYLHYEVQKEELLNNAIYRNTGIFYEGPKYVLLLSIFLMYELYVSKKSNYKRAVIFTITAITTFSMTGIYAILLIWILYIFTKSSAKTIRGFVVRIIFLLAFFVFGYRIFSSLEDMFSIKATTSSYSTRMDNYTAGFLAWLENPIMGVGYLNMTTIQEHYSSFRLNDIGYSNSIFRVLAQGGVYLFLMYLIPVIKAIKQGIMNKNWFIIAFVIVFLFFFITTSFPYNYVMYLVLCLMYFGTNNEEQSVFEEE